MSPETSVNGSNENDPFLNLNNSGATIFRVTVAPGTTAPEGSFSVLRLYHASFGGDFDGLRG
jgi:hypothetical protein